MSVTLPKGFTASGSTAGLKASGRPDVAVVHNTGPSMAAAAVFTTNRVFAAPVKWSRQAVSDGQLQAIVLNSGGANACTGAEGYKDSATTAARVASNLGLIIDNVAVCSTGLIGVRLPMDKLLPGVDAACSALTTDGGAAAAAAIMTTDTVAKQAGVTVGQWSIGGMAKGAGMLAPGLATMLVVLTTDADLGAKDLDKALREATRLSFDRADSDGCMSTNDTVALLASGAAGVRPEIGAFTAALVDVCQDLARQLIADAEGAQHEIAIEVTGAATERDAEVVGREIARSNLFKCAVFGGDPNWGRVLSAIGVTDAKFNAEDLDVSFNGVMVCRGGQIGDDRNLVDLSGRHVTVTVDLHAGNAAATILTNDLTYDYVKENAEYST
ncbi:bifunctional glutamate N-acetyltransferase/amino-acid acetyltransferase ArgJ [Tessaracoccus sp. ZS01]|uniref:bifunctional glutamate N-acetyltransferase/amino-acid acetyltransferase ArgJ n=1 Tax=Tessaracoccus sp. ZS01 TaxID=1906324 RepID=UPI00096F0E33|nr:bifunctional glutamate N-acetyltransferase/amino-acid acetyltransferase ArgJ [Tessaracoccus sp. ZS01]MCG6568673.1 bifunctional glutamate N-acetyltransferase/amino-acid acetyltransferase ArgJ [Tessaracoccus sp. ZS01]OMG51999.1 bifunctional ornithine acetyltransferase/N-acetylglutamate synthase [Tessaracoccus sp. ZS01]